MRSSVSIIIAAALLLASAAVQAQSSGNLRYRWRDNQGLPHYSDSLTSDAMKYGYDVVNDDGLAIQHVQRQLTPEERAAAKREADALAAQRSAADERARADAQTLAAYPTEDVYKQAQQQELVTMDQQMSTTRINLRSQEKALADLLARGADMERAKQSVPRSLSDSIAQQRNVVAAQRAALDKQQAARDVAAQDAGKRLEHYRALKAAQAQPSSTP